MASQDGVLGQYTHGFAVFGAIAASYVTLKFLCSLWSGLKAYILAGPLGLRADLKKMGQWAVVTGATDGIGKAYAQELAKLGLDIVLISRNPDKLSDVANEIEKTSKVKTKCVSIDFTGGPEIYSKIKKEIGSLDIGVLVNNVGMAYFHPDYYGDLDEQAIRNLIVVNVTSVAEMTKIVLPGMSERKRGAILNISSGSGLRPTPLLTLYSATKSFVDFFSQALQTEYRSKGIIVQSVMPFFVATKLSKVRRANIMIPSPTTYVKSALATVGIEDRTFGCISHAIQGYVASRAPACIFGLVVFNQMKGLRAKALKRIQQEQKGQ